MDEGAETHHPRKRHRFDEFANSSVRLSHSSGVSGPHNNRSAHLRAGHSLEPESDFLLPSTNDATTPILEPLHPPIPNFSAISQGASRSSSQPQVNAESSGSIVYNIALPLPNPGRAHRFCQACDHVNHVRRKLCTNCGAPKPSAVRNAVGVRSISAVEVRNDNRLHTHLNQHGFDHSNDADLAQRLKAHDVRSADTRHDEDTANRLQQRVPEYPAYHAQARSLVLRGQGDEMPLLGNMPRGSVVYNNFESQNTTRSRGPPAILSEPLMNINPLVQSTKSVARQNIHQVTNPVDFSQRIFPVTGVDRDHFTLPSVQGIHQFGSFGDYAQKPVPGTSLDREQATSSLPSVHGFQQFAASTSQPPKLIQNFGTEKEGGVLASVPGIKPYGGLVEPTQKEFSAVGSREHSSLPPVQGFTTQGMMHGNSRSYKGVGGGQMHDGRGPQSRGVLRSEDMSLSDELLGNRSMQLSTNDARQTIRQYRNVHGLRQLPTDDIDNCRLYQSLPFSTTPRNGLYKPNTDFFPSQQSSRNEDHDNGFRGGANT